MASPLQLRRKRVPKRLTYRRRNGYGQVLTCNDQVILKQMKQFICFIMPMLEENSEDASLRSYLDYLIFRYVSVAYCEDIPLHPSLPSMCRGIDSFEREQYKPYFRFEK